MSTLRDLVFSSMYENAEVEYTDEQLEELFTSGYWAYQQECARKGYKLDELVENSDPMVRWMVAKFGGDEELDILVHDSTWMVRDLVALRGRPEDLKILIDDPAEPVRVTAQKMLNKIDHGIGEMSDTAQSAVANQEKTAAIEKDIER